MAPKYVEPSISAVAFNCPHCGALADQLWYEVRADDIENRGTPYRPTPEQIESIRNDVETAPEVRKHLVEYVEKMLIGNLFFEKDEKNLYSLPLVHNIAISQCFSCRELAVWVADKVIHPPSRIGVEPNSDLPPDIARDFNEARLIVDNSPRGAAALLRLCIQKLCVHLKEPGENINEDIASLVKKGLAPRVQKALDIVRVVGNEAAHPGQMDLRDDRDTALKLFDLVNLVAEIMISQPAHVDRLYMGLPADKLNAIAKRDKGKS